MSKKSKMLVDGTACPVCGSRNFIEVDGHDECERGHVYDATADAQRLQEAGVAAGFKLHFRK